MLTSLDSRHNLPWCFHCWSDAACGCLAWGLAGTLGPSRQRCCTLQYLRFYTYIYWVSFLLASQLLLCQSKLLLFRIWHTKRQKFTFAYQIAGLCWLLVLKTCIFSTESMLASVPRHGEPFAWVLACLVGFGGAAWGGNSVGFLLHYNSGCQDSVSHWVLCHPSILVVY